MADIGKWKIGPSYGPVLTQTELYLLKIPVELHPMLCKQSGSQLIFNLATGQTGILTENNEEAPFSCKDEPATMPRITQLAIVTRASPWCTVVRNPEGVTLNDVCSALFRDYAEIFVTDEEFSQLPNRVQDAIKRIAAMNASEGRNAFYQPAMVPTQFRRSEWLRERTYFDGLKVDDNYMMDRLGYKAANLFRLDLAVI